MTELEKKTEKELGDSYKQIGKLLSENMGAGIQEGSDAAVEASDQLYKGLLESQQSYFDEKKRLEQTIEAAEEAQHQREYQNRLSRAKTAKINFKTSIFITAEYYITLFFLLQC